MEKFKDPSSHYHIPPGTSGPSHEEDHSTSRHPSTASSASLPSNPESSSSATGSKVAFDSKLAEGEGDDYHESRLVAMEMFKAEGYDVEGTLEWPVAWGDCDMFQYVFSKFPLVYDPTSILYHRTVPILLLGRDSIHTPPAVPFERGG